MNGAHEWLKCAEIYVQLRESTWRISRGQMKSAKAEAILYICLFARFIQDLYDDREKTMVETKVSVNTPMAQLVEVTLEEESAIRSEKLKKFNPDKGQVREHKSKDVQWVKNERKEV